MTCQEPIRRIGPIEDPSDCHRDISIAASQIELAIQESLKPVDDLGRALGSIGSMVEQLAHGLADDEGARPMLDGLRAELAVCVQALQFHDCLVQHLSHVRDYLALGAGTAEGEAVWVELRNRLRGRLISPDQRALFDLLMDPTRYASSVDSRTASADPAEGSVELF